MRFCDTLDSEPAHSDGSLVLIDVDVLVHAIQFQNHTKKSDAKFRETFTPFSIPSHDLPQPDHSRLLIAHFIVANMQSYPTAFHPPPISKPYIASICPTPPSRPIVLLRDPAP